MTLNVTVGGEITFYRKVSSENSYDYLKFYIDNDLQGQWSGEEDWVKETHTVATGNRTFKWVYKKDNSAGNGSDCAWIDYITFPVHRK